MDTAAYLARIGAEAPAKLDLAALATLQRRHLLAVPFENLDIVAGVPVALDPAKLHDKVVARRRGGFCFELNGLFHELLARLGFEPVRVGARVRGPGGAYGDENGHLALVVPVDGRPYLVDVGFGDGPRRPIPLDGTPTDDSVRRWRVVPAADFPHLPLRLEREVEDGWEPEYVFAATPRALADFEAACAWHQTAEGAPFNRAPLTTLQTQEGHVTLGADRLILTSGERKTAVPVRDAVERTRILKDTFGIVL
jgi:N-hydroxyarylamine O-acetyltransferase